MMEFADIGEVRKALGLNKRPGNSAYLAIPGPEIEEALKNAKQEDAVKVIRCEKCFWCIQSQGLRKPLCTVPGRPAHRTTLNGYCDQGKKKGGFSND